MTGSVKLNTPSAGSVTLRPADTASNVTVTIPASTATLVNASSTQTLTNKTMTAAGGNAVEATSGPTSTQLAGMRNKIINGAMMIDQRNAGASVTIPGAATTYTLDRWNSYTSQASKISIQQNAGAVTPPAGFTKYLGVTSLSAYTVTSNDTFQLAQVIEGFNCIDLSWGTANASPATLSFWVYSSLTGTFGGSIATSKTTVWVMPFSYTISSANTWTYVTVAIPAATSTAGPNTDNTSGIFVRFGLGSAGTSAGGTAGTWTSAGNYIQPSGTVSVVGTNGATFYITGVQLEKGATATPFENRLYGTELALCQRYYEKKISATNYSWFGIGAAGSSTSGSIYVNYQLKRAAPTFESTTASTFQVTATTCTAISLADGTTLDGCKIDVSVASGLSSGNAISLRAANSTSTYIAFSSEL